MTDHRKNNPLDLYDSEDPGVLRSRICGPYRLSVYRDTFYRVEKRLDGKPIPEALRGQYTDYVSIVQAVKVSLSNEDQEKGKQTTE